MNDGALRILSPRELEALQLSADDMKQSAIAMRMNISLYCVANLLTTAHAKLGVASTNGAIAQGFRLGLLR